MTGFPLIIRASVAPLLALMVSAFALVGLTAPAAATPESDCFNFVQGNIPWNQSGYLHSDDPLPAGGHHVLMVRAAAAQVAAGRDR